MKRILRWLLALVYPKNAVCMGCGSAAGFEGEWLCPACKRLLAKKWSGPFPDAKLDGAAAARYYSGPAGAVVRSMKYRGVWRLKDLMVEDMLRAYALIQPTGAEMAAFVPMHPRRLRRRGFNQSELLARETAKRLGIPCGDVLIRTRDTVQQARLSGRERKNNLKDAFCADASVCGKRVLLVDDVYTTGATAHECARALRAAGAASVSFLAYAMGNTEERK